jgi:hypothetical protein
MSEMAYIYVSPSWGLQFYKTKNYRHNKPLRCFGAQTLTRQQSENAVYEQY